MKKAYLDCNILLDWLLEREPHSYYAARIIELTENNKIKSYISPLTLANTYYIISKSVNKKLADEFCKDALTLFNFVSISRDNVEKAVNEKFRDFEDDLHFFAAAENRMDYLITGNKKHFRKDKIEVLDAEELVMRY